MGRRGRRAGQAVTLALLSQASKHRRLGHKEQDEMLYFCFPGLLPVISLNYFFCWALSLVTQACEPRVADFPSQAEEKGRGEPGARQKSRWLLSLPIISHNRGYTEPRLLWPEHRSQGLGSEWSSRAHGRDPFGSYSQNGDDGGNGCRVRSD